MWWVRFSAHAPGPRLASLLMRDAFLKEEREPTEENAGHEGPRLRSEGKAAAGGHSAWCPERGREGVGGARRPGKAAGDSDLPRNRHWGVPITNRSQGSDEAQQKAVLVRFTQLC